MSCLHPLRAFPTGAVSENGKPVYFVTSHRYSYATVYDFVKRGLPYKDLYVDDFIEIPCGKCVACRKHKQSSWAFRCVAEAQLHPFRYFLTLTYENAPSELSKRDLQLFNKRLRKICGPFRFFGCGEYGELYGRPHFHELIFCESEFFPDQRLYSKKGSYSLYNSAILSKVWPYGFSVIGTMTPASAGYCSKYCVKGGGGFILMSRKPGLGDAFFEANLDSISSLVLPTGEGRALLGGLPRYVKQKHNITNVFNSDLRDFAALRDSGLNDMDDFRDLEDYLLKHPALVSVR